MQGDITAASHEVGQGQFGNAGPVLAVMVRALAMRTDVRESRRIDAEPIIRKPTGNTDYRLFLRFLVYLQQILWYTVKAIPHNSKCR